MKNYVPFLNQILAMSEPHDMDHSDHVAVLAAALGRKVDLTSKRINHLLFAAAFHDIGKIAINDSVINKPGRLTEAEYVMVKHHSTLGAKLIGSLAIDPDIASIILNHHENFDGTGYPNQARGEAIPLEARIIRIADTYDALTTNRAYRAAYTVKKAFQIMEREHALFDPCLLDLFLKMKYRSQMG